MQLSVIIVSTNERRVLVPCLKSVFQQTQGIAFEVLVVDNGSTDGTLEMLASDFPHVKVLRNETNLGFAVSNNRGIRASAGEFVILLNPDTEVLDGALQKTVSFMQRHPRVGVAGCKLFYPSGAVQQSVRSFPSLWNLFCETTFLYLLFPGSKSIGQYYMTYFDYSSTREVDWVSGACFMIRREVINAIGTLDEQFFIYTEELEYCYRTRQAGFRVFFYSGAAIVHHWGGPRTTNQRLIFWGHKSQVLFIKKHCTGFKKHGMLLLKYLGVALRVPVYLSAGVLTLNKRHFLKSIAYARTVSKLIRNSPDW